MNKMYVMKWNEKITYDAYEMKWNEMKWNENEISL